MRTALITAMMQADDIVNQIDEATEELIAQVKSDVCHGACRLGCIQGGHRVGVALRLR